MSSPLGPRRPLGKGANVKIGNRVNLPPAPGLSVPVNLPRLAPVKHYNSVIPHHPTSEPTSPMNAWNLPRRELGGSRKTRRVSKRKHRKSRRH
jgi:hypothetical protein